MDIAHPNKKLFFIKPISVPQLQFKISYFVMPKNIPCIQRCPIKATFWENLKDFLRNSMKKILSCTIFSRYSKKKLFNVQNIVITYQFRPKISYTGPNICHVAWSLYLEICRFGQKLHKKFILTIFSVREEHSVTQNDYYC